MSQVIAGMYELRNQIGSGGGGIVYFGKHIRLEKDIVLKADKRKLSTKPELLRREVDMLKGLSHKYIPQVYDFVQEEGTVYTVMDFIDGRSMDKLLEEGKIPSQPQVIGWACQLLEALSYLHSRPPHGILHGDIKPANIMLRSDGDVCLIDYNIALALGEDGAVQVGYSSGYASPEHYGIEYKSGSKKSRISRRTTVMVGESKHFSGPSLEGGSVSGKRQVTLDVRSDIYSLGATLYHLISGRNPEEDARDVIPLGEKVCSPQISEIIRKAMNPNADMRYQTADEMLEAFRQLHRRDRRVIRRKRRIVLWTAVSSILFLAGGTSTFSGLRQMERIQEALALAEYSSNHLAEGNVSQSVRLALQSLDTSATAQAQRALTDALGVYDLSEGYKSLDIMDFPSAPFGITVSPEGSCFAVTYPYETAVYEMEERQKIVSLAMENSALSDVLFVDETHLVYAGDQGIAAYDLSTRKVLWTGQVATTLAVSADGRFVAAVNRDEDYGIVYRVSDGKKMRECSFGGHSMKVAANDTFANPRDRVFALNRDGTMLAVSFQGGGLGIFDLENPDMVLMILEESRYEHFEGGFCGPYFVFAADAGEGSTFCVIDVEKAIILGTHEFLDRIWLQVDESGIYLAEGSVLASLELDTLELDELKERVLAYTEGRKITGFSIGKEHVLVATDEPGFSFYDRGANLVSSESSEENCDFLSLGGDYAVVGNRNQPWVRFMKRESHREALLLSYDPHYDHREARISQDKKTAMLFDNAGFRVYGMEGNLVSEVRLPESEQIYDQQFMKNSGNSGSSFLEVIWYDGTVRCYSAEDGSLLSEISREAPSKELKGCLSLWMQACTWYFTSSKMRHRP